MLALPRSRSRSLSRSLSPSLWPTLLSAACLLAACGGGGGGDEATPPTPAGGLPASGCSPTRPGCDAVQPGMDPSAMAAEIGCSGAVVSQTTVEGLAQTTFHWGEPGAGPYAQVQVRGGRVTGKIRPAARRHQGCLPLLAHGGVVRRPAACGRCGNRLSPRSAASADTSASPRSRA